MELLDFTPEFTPEFDWQNRLLQCTSLWWWSSACLPFSLYPYPLLWSWAVENVWKNNVASPGCINEDSPQVPRITFCDRERSSTVRENWWVEQLCLQIMKTHWDCLAPYKDDPWWSFSTQPGHQGKSTSHERLYLTVGLGITQKQLDSSGWHGLTSSCTPMSSMIWNWFHEHDIEFSFL